MKRTYRLGMKAKRGVRHAVCPDRSPPGRLVTLCGLTERVLPVAQGSRLNPGVETHRPATWDPTHQRACKRCRRVARHRAEHSA